MVERIAHNGFVVGSNPTKPIFKIIKTFMKLNSKIYKTTKTKNFIKTTNLFFFFNGNNKKATDWIATERDLKNIHFQYYKIFNKIASKTFNNSIFKNFESTVNGISFFIKPSLSNNSTIKKHILFNNFEFLLFKLITIKLNNKMYSIKQFNKTFSMNYKNNKILLYQFGIVNLKINSYKKYS